jgi:hypothetical protein
MSKPTKPAAPARPGKNDPKLILQLNTAENARRNVQIFNNQTHATVAAKDIIDLLIDTGTDIIYNNYLMREKMPTHLSNIYTSHIQQIVNVDQITHDINGPIHPNRKFEEDIEPVILFLHHNF